MPIWRNEFVDAGVSQRPYIHVIKSYFICRRYMREKYKPSIWLKFRRISLRNLVNEMWSEVLIAWHRYMMTSSNGNIFRVTCLLCGEFTGPGEFPGQRPVTRSLNVFFYLRLNKRLSKQWWGWWFETLSRPLWRHRNVANHTFTGTVLGKLVPAIVTRLMCVISIYSECTSCIAL